MKLQKILEQCLRNAPAFGLDYRGQQSAMAGQVLDAIQSHQHLLIEAGTGTGKTLAYLLPAVLSASITRLRGFIITYTKALQDQIIEKDLPLALRLLGKEYNIKYTVSYGSSNYLCLLRLERAGENLFRNEVSESTEWLQKNTDGLLDNLPVEPELRNQICREPDQCLRRQCPYYQRCHYFRSKQREKESGLVILNHSLFFTNLKSAQKEEGQPDFIIFDEAHRIEDAVSEHLSRSVSLKNTLNFLENLYAPKKGFLKRYGIRNKDLVETIQGLESDILRFFQDLEKEYKIEDKVRLKKSIQESPENIYQSIEAILAMTAKIDCDKYDIPTVEVEAIQNSLITLQENLHDFNNQLQKGMIYLIDKNRGDISLKMVPLAVRTIFDDNVLKRFPSVILTSATLSVNGSFDYIKSVLTSETPILELSYPSIFNFKKRVILYLPDEIHPAGHDDPEYLAAEIIRLTNISKGRAFVLFTNRLLLNKVFGMVQERSTLSLLKQDGETSNFRLLERFKATSNAVLFGNISFWQGVDIQGEALKSVIITHLPFKVPSDPVVEARTEYYQDLTDNGFLNYIVPMAGISLKQGFGRLIRSEKDSGIVAILDQRIITRPYGRWLLNSLPDTERTSNLARLEQFLDGKH